MATPREDDDILPGLPALDGDDEPVEGTDSDVDSTEDADADADESVGLDAETGPAELDEAADEVDAGDDAERWLDAAEAADDAAPVEDGIDGVDEEGQSWTDGSEEFDDPALADDDLPDEPDLPPAPDRGEEGVDEADGSGGSDDDAELPPLSALTDAADDASEDLDLREEGEIEDVPEIEDDIAASAGRMPPRLSHDRVSVEHLGPAGEAMFAVACARAGERTVAGGTRLYAAAEHGPLAPLEAAGLESHEITTIALDPHDAERIAVGTRLGGAFRSIDGGATFHEINGWRHREPGNVTVPFLLVAEPHASGTRLWGRTRTGALYRSEDFGSTWLGPVLTPPVAAVARDAAGGVVAIHFGRRGGEQLARSEDGGRGWRMSEPIGRLRGDGAVQLATLGPVTAMARDGESAGVFYSTDSGVTWDVARALREPTALALAEEDGQLALYAALFLEGEDKGVVVRQVLGGDAHVVLDIDHERAARTLAGPDDSEGEGRVHELVVSRAGGLTTLLAATQVGVFRVVVRTAP